MNNISAAIETRTITSAKKYIKDGQEILLPDFDYEEVVVYSPSFQESFQIHLKESPLCHFTVVNEDSFQAAKKYDCPFVMNFANAHCPGGGFLAGATAQEEALCRCSTLYESINSKAAKEMYHYNNTHLNPVESDYMLYSPNVCVFRNQHLTLLEKPFLVSVITLPAPNRRGAAIFASNQTIADAMIRRIRMMCNIAYENHHKNLILGAWGCGAFGNNPQNVAQYFKQILIDEGYGSLFDEICFAIYGKTDSKNYRTFFDTFQEKQFDRQEVFD